jgi:DNA-binding transcriptional LysR family regulator
MYRQRQGDDLTGFTGLLDVVAPKALELLSELVPAATIVALLTTDGSSKWGDMRWLRIRGVDVSRGLCFKSADRALDATGEGVGVLLAHDVFAYDDLSTGRLVIPVDFALRSDRAYYFVCSKNRKEHSYVGAVFRLAGSPPIMEASHGNSGTRLPGYWNNQD